MLGCTGQLPVWDRDTLQSVIKVLRENDFGIDMQFTNYRTN